MGLVEGVDPGILDVGTDDFLDDVESEVIFIGEVVEESAFGDLRLLDDEVEACALEPVVVEGVVGGGENAETGGLRFGGLVRHGANVPTSRYVVKGGRSFF